MDKLIWSSRMTQDYAKGLNDEEKKNFLVDRGYDAEMLDGSNLDDIIAQDDYMWQDDAEDFDSTVAPMINSQTYNGIVLAIDKDNPRVEAVSVEDLIGGDIASDSNAARIVDNNGLVVEYYFNDTPVKTLELYAIPEGESEQQDFVQDVMPGYADSLQSETDEEVMPVDIQDALSDKDILEDWVDKDALRKVGTRIRSTLGESLEECDELKFPEELTEEIATEGLGVDNAKKFVEYLRANDGDMTGPFGEEPVEARGDAVRLHSQVDDVTFNFTDDGGVIVEGENEEEGPIEEYFDTIDDFNKWFKSMSFTYSSDLGANIDQYLSGGEIEESLNEGEACEEPLEEAKKAPQKTLASNPEALAEEVEEIEMDFEDFGPEGFYNVPFESFKKEFPEFTKDVIETFLIKFVNLKPEELNDPEVIEAWKSGDLITKMDWKPLIEGAKQLVDGKEVYWVDVYKKHYNKFESLEEGKDCDDSVEEGLEDKELKEGNVEKLKKHYGPMFDEKLEEDKDYLVVPGDLDVLK